jgi:hypothetical protein
VQYSAVLCCAVLCKIGLAYRNIECYVHAVFTAAAEAHRGRARLASAGASQQVLLSGQALRQAATSLAVPGGSGVAGGIQVSGCGTVHVGTLARCRLACCFHALF